MIELAGAYLLAKQRKFIGYDPSGVAVPCPLNTAKNLVRVWQRLGRTTGRYDGVHWIPGRVRVVTGCNGAGSGAVRDV